MVFKLSHQFSHAREASHPPRSSRAVILVVPTNSHAICKLLEEYDSRGKREH